MRKSRIGLAFFIITVILLSYVHIIPMIGVSYLGFVGLGWVEWLRIQGFLIFISIAGWFPTYKFLMKAYSETSLDIDYVIEKLELILTVVSLGIPYVVYIITRTILEINEQKSITIDKGLIIVSVLTLGINWLLVLLLAGYVKLVSGYAIWSIGGLYIRTIDVISWVLGGILSVGLIPLLSLMYYAGINIVHYVLCKKGESKTNNVIPSIMIMAVLTVVTSGVALILFGLSYLLIENFLLERNTYTSIETKEERRDSFYDVMKTAGK